MTQRRSIATQIRFASNIVSVVVVCLASVVPRVASAQEDLSRLEQKAMQAAVERVAPSVVKIETVGGLERVGQLLVGTGPTTGLIVSHEGHVISSAFNFVQKPNSILVVLPDGTRAPARLVATDHQRMLVLLKINANEPLHVPDAVAESEMRVGQWSIAVGRTFDGEEPNVSIGIVSGLNRIWGKAIQTDAKISPLNYGGPLVDIQGRVLGVLVPLSPQSSDDVAGVEWYDSGIGFAVTLEHINKILPRLKEGEDLKPGVLGVNLDGRDLYGKSAVLTGCRANSPAAKAGLKAGDRIVEVDGQPIERQAQLRQQINKHYAGDTLRVVVLRGSERIEREIPLVDRIEAYQKPFVGILPRRDGPKEGGGVVVRFVYADSPAVAAGIEIGDVLVAVNEQAIGGREALLDLAKTWEVGQSLKLKLHRGEQTIEKELATVAEPDAVPDELPPAAEKREAEKGERPAVGTIAIKIPEFKNECVAYVPGNYDSRLPSALVVWLHPAGRTPDDELIARWRRACEAANMILLAPKSASADKWLPAEMAFIRKTIDQIRSDYQIDPERVVVHGHQAGGSLGYAVASQNREIVRGVASVDAPILGRVAESEPATPLRFYVTTAKKANFARQISEGIERLRQLKYTVTVEDQGDDPRYLDDAQFARLLRWIDSLDRI